MENLWEITYCWSLELDPTIIIFQYFTIFAAQIFQWRIFFWLKLLDAFGANVFQLHLSCSNWKPKNSRFSQQGYLFGAVWVERIVVLLTYPFWKTNDELYNLWNSHLADCIDCTATQTQTHTHPHMHPSNTSPRYTVLYTLIKKSLLTFMRPINFTRAIKTIWSFIKISFFLSISLFFPLAHTHMHVYVMTER